MLPGNLLHPLKLDVVGFKEEDHDYHFRRWVLDVLDRETARELPGLSPAELPRLDWLAVIRSANRAPSIPVPAEIQTAINRKAWALCHEAYTILQEHIGRCVAFKAELGHPREIHRRTALAVINATTLGAALAPAAQNRLDLMQDMADCLVTYATETREKFASLELKLTA